MVGDDASCVRSYSDVPSSLAIVEAMLRLNDVLSSADCMVSFKDRIEAIKVLLEDTQHVLNFKLITPF